MKQFRLILFLMLTLAFFSESGYPKVKAPNYNFSLDSLAFFLPGKSLIEAQKKYGKGTILKKGPITTYRFYVAQIRYKFPVIIQASQGKIIDMFANLPTYFLHDIFHQSLINRYGKQDIYKKKEGGAVYTWKNKDGIRHTYSGTCTITCFPIYESAGPATSAGAPGGFKTLLLQFYSQESVF